VTALRAPLDGRPILSLADLEAFDQGTADGHRERRFCCPLEACAGKPRNPAHRCLNVNMESGLWNCKRCGAAGKLRERWDPPQRVSSRASARRAFALPPRESPAVPPATGVRPEDSRDAERWRRRYDQSLPLEGSPAAEYLARRGLSVDQATAAGVRYLPDWQHWDKQDGVWRLLGSTPRVLFPIRSLDGALVALHGRALEDDAPLVQQFGSKLTRGPRSAGVFATEGALASPFVAFVEGPCDALALAECGVPSVAVIGTNVPDWLPKALAFRTVIAATDADESGDRAAAELAARLTLGTRVERWRPNCKDWNAALLEHGVEALRAAFAERLANAASAVADPPHETANTVTSHTLRLPASGCLGRVAPEAGTVSLSPAAPVLRDRCLACGGWLQGYLAAYGWCRDCIDGDRDKEPPS